MTNFLIIVAIFLSFLLYCFLRFHFGDKPTITVNPESPISGYLQLLQTIRRMHATPWLIGPHMQTIWAMKFRPTSKVIPHREEFTFSDGGVSFLIGLNR
jgi:hypothetical protein